MRYLTEIKFFYDWLEVNNVGSGAIALWHALMHIANKSGWASPLAIPLSTLEARSGLTRSCLYRERKKLRDVGLIEFTSRGGRQSCLYVIYSLELHFASQYGKQSESQGEFDSQFVPHIGKQIATIYRQDYINNKENIKRKIEVGAEAPPYLSPSPEKKEKVAPKRKKSSSPQWDISAWLSGLEPPWLELMQTWLEYKASRKERYKSEISVSKCLAQLQKLSGNNPKTAQQIIDQSIANNWAGLFELKRQAYYPRGEPTPARGQHIGQIIQPESEEKKSRILANFGKKQ